MNLINACVICGARHLHYEFTLEKHRIVRCDDCGFMIINPQPSDEVLGQIYGDDYFVLSSEQGGLDHVEALKKSTADRYLDLLFPESTETSGSLLEIGC